MNFIKRNLITLNSMMIKESLILMTMVVPWEITLLIKIIKHYHCVLIINKDKNKEQQSTLMLFIVDIHVLRQPYTLVQRMTNKLDL